LGDDYLRKHNIQGEDNSWEALRGIASVHPWAGVASFMPAISTRAYQAGVERRDALQGGMEIYFNNSEHVHWHPYLATDLQSWARSAWNPTFTAEIGIKTGASIPAARASRISSTSAMARASKVSFTTRKKHSGPWA
jgi:hypothetical protein